MRRALRILGIVGLFGVMTMVLAGVAAWGLDVPPLGGRVNDLAGLLSPDTAKRLESELAALEASDSTQVVVLTVPSLQGETIEGFAIKTAQKWGIGQKGTDNGALLVVSKGDRAVRIEVGRGLEGTLTDALTGRIIDHVIVPEFKKGDFNAGVEKGVGSIMAAARGEYKGTGKQPGGAADDDASETIFAFGLIACAVLMSVLRFLPAFVRAGIGGAGMLVLTLLASAGVGLIVIMTVLGVVFGIVAPFVFRAGRGGGGGFFGGGGGFSGGGGGGFSGGGGSFGGGGSSGKW
ncbi:TPM domain-containing protein [Desulfolutivibrio sulfoxidireducens]|uniref:TPM domain-containing protein n=1 Tax=Desulfolutivibrio sulfoxidireducens TaxID=2773299 RepID=UPI00159E8D87|nr:TPM domain-containing protein [Desulfolutivibrio sulfoxidireducens]